MNFDCCELAATAPGTCCKCIESGRSEMAGRPLPSPYTVVFASGLLDSDGTTWDAAFFDDVLVDEGFFYDEDLSPIRLEAAFIG